jgi:glycolate oxidase
MLCAFPTYAAGGDAVAAIIAAGIVPAGLEMMDGLTVELVDEFLNLGYPQGAALVMICETDGQDEDAKDALDRVMDICKEHSGTDFRVAKTSEERDLLWRGRKAALPAVGRKATDYYCIDGTIPRRELGAVLEKISQLSQKYGLACANVFHAGDGNLHPLIMFHAGNADEVERAKKFGSDVLQACLAAGGTITGEHGVGIEKLDEMCLQFSQAELDCFYAVKAAFDPDGILNPGKAVPTLQRCAEFGAMHVHEGKLPHPQLDRF